MNQYDKANLQFLLKSSPEVLRDWYSKMSADDILYAQELLKSYEMELEETAIEYQLKDKNFFPEVLDFLDNIRDMS